MRQSTNGGGAEREGDTESEAGSRLWTDSTEPDAGLELTDREIVTWAEVGRSTDWATQEPLMITIFKHSSGLFVRILTEEILYGVAGQVWALSWPFQYLKFDNYTASSRSLCKLTSFPTLWCPGVSAGLKRPLNNQPTNHPNHIYWVSPRCLLFLIQVKIDRVHYPYPTASLLVPY